MKQLLTPKEKFREVVDAFLSEMYVTEITNQCTRINIEEKIELLKTIKQLQDIEMIIFKLQNELRQLEK